MKDHRPPLYLFTGIIIGVLVGLLITYVLLPVRYTNTAPDTLSAAQKEIYRSLVGRAYLYEADSGRAFSRLALLQDNDLNTALVAQSQQLAAEGTDLLSARGLALLASAMTQPGLVITPLIGVTPTAAATKSQPATRTPAPTPTSPPAITATTPVHVTRTPVQPTSTPFATFTPRPSATPAPTQGAPFQLVSKSGDCDKNPRGALLTVNVLDASGNGLPGVKIEISLPNGGSEDFYTGFYPEIGEGYADYSMSPDITYSLRVGIGGEPVVGLQLPQCNGSAGQSYTVDLELVFQQ
jgi:hypothetical protein